MTRRPPAAAQGGRIPLPRISAGKTESPGTLAAQTPVSSQSPRGQAQSHPDQTDCTAVAGQLPAGRCPAGGSARRYQVRIGRTLASQDLPSRADPARTGLARVGEEPLWASPACREGLCAAGLDHFADLMQGREGTCMRALPDRENWRLVLPLAGRPRVVYLKKHHVRGAATRLRAWLGLPPRASAGRDEAQNIRRLEAAGIPCVELAAYGERLDGRGRLESLTITPELEGFTPLDDFLRQRFPVLNAAAAARKDRSLARLIECVGSLVRRFHQAGFNHRDLYCCHFFVREPSPGVFEIRLIDLQRVQQRARFRQRWLVKDLAQLAYSAPRDRVKCTHKVAFLRAYFGTARLGPKEKRLVRRILGKQQAMECKLGLIA
jgi:heptose I phosphotransferase